MKTFAQKVRAALVLSSLATVAAVALAAGTEDAQAGITINLHQACLDQGGLVSMKPTAYSVPISSTLFCDFTARASLCPQGSRFDMTVKNCVVDHPEADPASDTACWLPSIPLTKPHAPSLCPSGAENIGGTCYAACPTGFNAVGPVCWSGAKSQPRAVKGPAKCAARETLIGGVCYENVGRASTPCPAGYDLVGPVCYAQCPAEFPQRCGGACAKTADSCADSILKQVETGVKFTTSVMTTIMSGGEDWGAIVSSGVDLGQAFNLRVCPAP